MFATDPAGFGWRGFAFWCKFATDSFEQRVPMIDAAKLTAQEARGNMRQFTLLAAILLSGCGDYPRPRTEEEIRNIAEDVADDVVSDRAPNASDTEEKLEELSGKIDSLTVENRSLRSELDALRSEYEAHRHPSY